MGKILRIHLSILFYLLVLSLLASCYSSNNDNEKKIEALLLLRLSQYASQHTGTITCLEAGDQKSYDIYAEGFFSDLISGTMIAANSGTIANRFIQINLRDNIKTIGAYSTPTDNIYIEILNGLTTTWSSNRTGGSALIEITKYGAVGDTIEGTFEGRLIYIDDITPLDIMNGQFAVRRKADM